MGFVLFVERFWEADQKLGAKLNEKKAKLFTWNCLFKRDSVVWLVGLARFLAISLIKLAEDAIFYFLN